MTDSGKKAEVTQDVSDGISVFAVRSPTLPPATHTNTYIAGRRSVTLFDPASPYPEEQAAFDRALASDGRTVDRLVLTHHHVDHVSGAMHLADTLGVPIFAHRLTAERLVGRVRVDELVDDNQVLDCGGLSLRAVFTPGHAPGHLCFVDDVAHTIVVGDMLASVGTIIVAPADDGDMSAYLSSLARLRTENARRLLPAHGLPIDDPAARIDGYIAHRLAREQKVLAALTETPTAVGELVPLAYPEISPAIYALAAQSLLAHLLKLASDGKARRHDELWSR